MLNPEHLLIPYQAAPLPSGPWLVFAPHGDDETFGMGGSLLKAHAEGIATHVVILTDGALGGDFADLIKTREMEVKAATDILGVDSVQYWQEPDRGLVMNERLIERSVQAILDLEPACVFFPGAMEIHPDHRVTGHLVWAGLQRLQKRGQVPQAFTYEISVQNPINLLIDVSAQLQQKAAAMAVYGSQNSQNNYQDLVIALDKARTFSLPPEVTHAEGFYHYAPQDLLLGLDDITHKILDRYFQVHYGD